MVRPYRPRSSVACRALRGAESSTTVVATGSGSVGTTKGGVLASRVVAGTSYRGFGTWFSVGTGVIIGVRRPIGHGAATGARPAKAPNSGTGHSPLVSVFRTTRANYGNGPQIGHGSEVATRKVANYGPSGAIQVSRASPKGSAGACRATPTVIAPLSKGAGGRVSGSPGCVLARPAGARSP